MLRNDIIVRARIFASSFYIVSIQNTTESMKNIIFGTKNREIRVLMIGGFGLFRFSKPDTLESFLMVRAQWPCSFVFSRGLMTLSRDLISGDTKKHGNLPFFN